MTEQFDEGMQRVIDKVRKLLNLAAKNPNEAEAASAAAKAQELLDAYNLDMASVGQGGESGAREEARQRGGMYIYERELWQAIAELNFCWYSITRERMKYKAGKMQWSFCHRIIGKKVNTMSSKVMAEYLQGAIERLCRERFPVNSQFFTREAVAFREGMSDKIAARLWRRRREKLDEEKVKAAEAAERAKASGVNTAFALTLASVKDAEHAANYDFMHGEGAWAKRKASDEQWSRVQADRRAAEAKAEAEADRAYAEWAAANPEEAAKEAAKERARQKKSAEREAKKERNRSYRYRAPSAREQRANSNYYDDGADQGSKISLEPQVGDRRDQKRIGR